MEVLKSVWRSPVAFRKKTKHKRVPEDQWGEASDPIIDGVGFHLKYIGSTLVDELPDGQSYGDGVSSEAVRTIVMMAKSKGNKLDKASLKISCSGIEVVDLTQDYTISKVSIDRICFCTADKHYDRVFAFIVRNTENETMECQAFMCDSRKMAHAVTLTVARAFSVAKEREQVDKSSTNVSSSDSCSNTDSPIIHLFDKTDLNSPSSSRTSSPCNRSTSSSCSLTNPANAQQSQKSNKQNIEDEFELEDSFSKLAQMRINPDEPGF